MSRFVVGTEGNLSYRTVDGFAVKSSGRSISDNSFVLCDIDGTPLSGQDDKPSMESSFHSFIYKNTDYKFIAHTHPTNVLKILCSSSNIVYDFANERLFPDQVVFNESTACVVPYATPGKNLTTAIMKAVTYHRSLSWPSLFLLRSHGIICCAYSMKQAVVMTEICEKSAEIFLGAYCPVFLTEQQVLEIENNKDETYRKHAI